MGALATRELIVAARTAAVPLTSLVSLGLLTAFVLVWSPGVNVLAPMNLYEQARALHWLLLATMLPWAAVRCSPRDRGDAGVVTIAFLGVQPASAIAAKVLASSVILVAVVLTGVPGLVMAQQAAAVPMTLVFADLLPLLGLVILVAASATAAILYTSDGLRAWLWTWSIVAAILGAAMRWMMDLSSAGVVCAVAGIVAMLCLQVTAGSFLTYLGDADAG
jgi:hypothetical protein